MVQVRGGDHGAEAVGGGDDDTGRGADIVPPPELLAHGICPFLRLCHYVSLACSSYIRDEMRACSSLYSIALATLCNGEGGIFALAVVQWRVDKVVRNVRFGLGRCRFLSAIPCNLDVL